MSKLMPRLAIATAFAATLVLPGCGSGEPTLPPPDPIQAPPPAPPPAAPTAPVAAPAAVVVVGVDLGKGMTSGGRIITPTTTFAPGDKVHASVLATTAEPGATVSARISARWSFQDGQVVGSHEVDASLTGPGTTSFTLEKEGPWPTGNYKVEIMVDGTLAETRQFRIAN